MPRSSCSEFIFFPDKPLVNLSKHADKHQQAFSSDKGPSLHRALPALEKLHKAWSTRASTDKYSDFQDALNAGAAKINDYYTKTAESDAYTFAMCAYEFFFPKEQWLEYFYSQCLTRRRRRSISRNPGARNCSRRHWRRPRKLYVIDCCVQSPTYLNMLYSLKHAGWR